MSYISKSDSFLLLLRGLLLLFIFTFLGSVLLHCLDLILKFLQLFPQPLIVYFLLLQLLCSFAFVNIMVISVKFLV